MTENEAIEALRLINTSSVHPFYNWEEMAEVRDIAISALKEIQQYREIGTVEECREAVGKQKPKKPRILVSRGGKGGKYCICPRCEAVTGKHIPFCRLCGQAIDWSNENERD